MCIQVTWLETNLWNVICLKFILQNCLNLVLSVEWLMEMQLSESTRLSVKYRVLMHAGKSPRMYSF